MKHAAKKILYFIFCLELYFSIYLYLIFHLLSYASIFWQISDRYCAFKFFQLI